MSNDMNENSLWEPAEYFPSEKEEIHAKKSYWKGIFSQFMRHKLGALGLFLICFIILAALVGPWLLPHDYSKTNLEFANLPLRLKIYQIDENSYIYMHKDYYFFRVTEQGQILERLSEDENDMVNRKKSFQIDDHVIVIDYSLAKKGNQGEKANGPKYRILMDGTELEPYKTVWNKTYLLGSDTLGRDVLARVLCGARISLLVAACSTLVNTVIGIFYGGISGYFGGYIDNIMMRLVEIISTVPTTLVVIMLMVVLGSGIDVIIIAMGISNWCTMARIVRGQVLSLKEQEFVLASITANAGPLRILTRHLIPNVSSSIIVCMTMMIPSAIFTETFLSFIGLGVSAPNASWGTLVSTGLDSMRPFPYQIIVPSIAISITILALNFVGNALQSVVNHSEER